MLHLVRDVQHKSHKGKCNKDTYDVREMCCCCCCWLHVAALSYTAETVTYVALMTSHSGRERGANNVRAERAIVLKEQNNEGFSMHQIRLSEAEHNPLTKRASSASSNAQEHRHGARPSSRHAS